MRERHGALQLVEWNVRSRRSILISICLVCEVEETGGRKLRCCCVDVPDVPDKRDDDVLSVGTGRIEDICRNIIVGKFGVPPLRAIPRSHLRVRAARSPAIISEAIRDELLARIACQEFYRATYS